MATVDHHVMAFSTRGVDKTRRALEGTGNAALRAAGRVKKLTRGIAAVGGSLIGANLARLGDDYTQLRIRVGLVTEGFREQNSVLEELRGISRRTRTDIRTNAEVFSRMALAVRGLGFSQRDALLATEALNAAMQISGASADETNASIIQFTQGLAANRLGGDELRSVLEQTPKVMDMINKELSSEFGVAIARGETRALAETGFYTAPRLMKGLTGESGKAIIEMFKDTRKTLRQQFVVMRNEFILESGKFMSTMGPSDILGDFMERITNNMETLIKLVTGTGIIVGITALGAAISAAFTPLGVALTSLIALFSKADKIKVLSGNGDTPDVFLIDYINAVIRTATDRVATLLGSVDSRFDDWLSRQEPGDALKNINKVVIDAMNKIIDIASTFVTAALMTLKGIAKSISFVAELGAKTLGLIGDMIYQLMQSSIKMRTGIKSASSFVSSMSQPAELLFGIDKEESVKKLNLISQMFESAELINVPLRELVKILRSPRKALKEEGTVFNAWHKQVTTFTPGALLKMDKFFADGMQALFGTMWGQKDKYTETKKEVNKFFSGITDFLGDILEESVKLAPQLAKWREEKTTELTKRLYDSLTPSMREDLRLLSGLPAGGPGEAAIPGMTTARQIESQLVLNLTNLLTQSGFDLKITQEKINMLNKFKTAAPPEEVLEKLFKLIEKVEIAERGASIRESFRHSEARVNIQAADQLLKLNQISPREHGMYVRGQRADILSTETGMFAGFERGMIQVESTITDVASTAETALVNAFQGAEDAMVNFVKTGKLEFKSLASSIIADLARIAIRQNLMPLLQQGVNAATGAALGAFGVGSGAVRETSGPTNISMHINTPDSGSFVANLPHIRSAAGNLS